MSWRTVVITKRCKLDVKLGYLVVRDEETSKIFLDEIALLVIENPAVSLTVCLLCKNRVASSDCTVKSPT